MPNKRVVIMKAFTGLWEAFPSDDSRWMSTNECRGPFKDMCLWGLYDSPLDVIRNVANITKCYELSHRAQWKVTIDHGSALLTTDYLSDYHGYIPSDDKLKLWREGRAQLYHTYVSVEMIAWKDSPLDDKDLADMLGVKEQQGSELGMEV